jgi:hypothetical protein
MDDVSGGRLKTAQAALERTKKRFDSARAYLSTDAAEVWRGYEERARN